MVLLICILQTIFRFAQALIDSKTTAIAYETVEI